MAKKYNVYGLFRKDVLVYVGVTKQPLNLRLTQHRSMGKKVDSIKRLYRKRLNRSDAFMYECVLIGTLNPKMNISEKQNIVFNIILNKNQYKQLLKKAKKYTTIEAFFTSILNN